MTKQSPSGAEIATGFKIDGPESNPAAQGAKRFSSPLYLWICLFVELPLVGGALLLAWLMRGLWQLGLFASCAIFLAVLVLSTIGVIRLICALFPLRPGIYTEQRHRKLRWAWDLIGALTITNLSLFSVNGLLPPLLRKPYYQLLGARIGKGLIPIGGRISDPWLISIGENVMIGSDALLLGHAVTADNHLLLGEIRVGRGALIGVRTVVMPGVEIGEYAMINAMSLVPMNTKIGPGEVWGGVPSKRISPAPENRGA